MPLSENIKYIHEPTPLQCGQAVLSMLSGKSTDEIAVLTGTEKETTLKDMLTAFKALDIECSPERKAAFTKEDLPEICLLSLETPRCWHWSLFYKGTFYDPEHGVLSDFPVCSRRYYWKITG